MGTGIKYYAFDIETTGLSPQTDRIIELALITPESSHSWLINPGVAISEQITQITGITQEMVDGGGSFSDVWNQFMETLPQTDYRMIGHNALNFDCRFMRAEELRMTRNACALNYPVIDTAALFKGLKLKRWPPTAPHSKWAMEVLNTRAYGLKYNLAHCAQEMGIDVPEGLHRAEADAALTLRLFHKMLERYPEIREVI